MPETTQGLWYPEETASPDVPFDMKKLAENVDKKFTRYEEGTLAARPAAAHANRLYKTTDTGVLYHDTGAAWEPVMPGLVQRTVSGVTNAVSGDLCQGSGTINLPAAGINKIVGVWATATTKVVAPTGAIYGGIYSGQASIEMVVEQSIILVCDGTNWVAMSLVLPGPFSYATTTIGAGNVVNGSSRAATLRPGALVSYRAMIAMTWNGSTEGGFSAVLLRDGLAVFNQYVKMANAGQNSGASAVVIDYIEAAGGAHTYAVTISGAGTENNINLMPGIMTFGQ